MNYQVNTEWDDSGWWVVTVPGVPGAITQTRRLDQVPADAAEVIEIQTGHPVDPPVSPSTRPCPARLTMSTPRLAPCGSKRVGSPSRPVSRLAGPSHCSARKASPCATSAR
jgi:predicted RNase H-like HicB family nuclease